MSDLTEVQRWAEELIHRHLDATWSFHFDHAKLRAGLCDHTRRRISMSRYLAARHSDHDNHQTLLHEVAHALAGPHSGHGAAWREVAGRLGYTGGTTHRLETAHELAAWIGACPSGHVIYRHRRPSRAASCSQCAPRFDRQYLISWSRREITAEDRREAMTPR